MNLGKLRLELAAGGALLVAAALGAIGLGLLLYAVLKIWLIPPVAAGLSFLAFALAAYIASRVIKAGAEHGHGHKRSDAHASEADGHAASLPQRVMHLAGQRPVLALIGGGLALALALRNPTLIATLAGMAIDRGLGGGRRR